MSTVPGPRSATARGPITAPPPIPQGIMHWRGRATGSWWAMVPGRQGPQLLEAVSRDALAAAVDRHLRWSA